MRRRRSRHSEFWKKWHEWREAGHSHEEWPDFFRQFMGTLPQKHWMFGGRRFKPWQMGEMVFNPFLATLLSKGGGILPLYVLHLLNRTPQYGNELMQEIVDRTDGQWFANPGAIYPLLNMLEKQGFVKGEWEDPDKRTIRRYHITPEGAEELQRLKDMMYPKIAEAIDVMQDLLADLGEGEDE